MRAAASLALLAGIALLGAGPGCGTSEALEPAGAAGSAGGGEGAPRAEVCPPCRMAVLPEYEVIEVDGMRFGVCNPRCAELVRRDAGRFAADALP